MTNLQVQTVRLKQAAALLLEAAERVRFNRPSRSVQTVLEEARLLVARLDWLTHRSGCDIQIAIDTECDVFLQVARDLEIVAPKTATAARAAFVGSGGACHVNGG